MAEDKLEVINPPNVLKKKVGTDGMGAIDLKAIEKAEEAIASMADSYLDTVASAHGRESYWRAPTGRPSPGRCFLKVPCGLGDSRRRASRIRSIGPLCRTARRDDTARSENGCGARLLPSIGTDEVRRRSTRLCVEIPMNDAEVIGFTCR